MGQPYRRLPGAKVLAVGVMAKVGMEIIHDEGSMVNSMATGWPLAVAIPVVRDKDEDGK